MNDKEEKGTSCSKPQNIVSAINYGWVCPKCNNVNAPWKSTCDCNVAYPKPPIPYNPFHPYGTIGGIGPCGQCNT